VTTTAEQIAALETAIAAGVKTVRSPDGAETTYHDIPDMLQALAALRSGQRQTASGRPFALIPVAHGDGQ